MSLSVSPQVYITLENKRDGSTTELTHFNKWRNSSGGLYLYNEDFSTISTQTNAPPDWMVRFQVVENGQDTDLTVNSTLTLEVVEAFETSDSQPSARATTSSPPPTSPAAGRFITASSLEIGSH